MGFCRGSFLASHDRCARLTQVYHKMLLVFFMTSYWHPSIECREAHRLTMRHWLYSSQQEYSKHLAVPPMVYEDMELVEQPPDHYKGKCTCHHKKKVSNQGSK